MNEEKVLEFWNKNGIFKKSLEKEAPNGEYVFYDGPPFATGLPHHGHILASVIKDAVPRYWTMRGYHVNRRWGWDTHGLPIENIVEKKLGISGKKEIEKLGIEKFNECAREQVLEYVSQWKETVNRIGRWVDFDGSYKTMDNTFIESVWWGLKKFNEKGLLYEGERVLPYCPRCETPIANSEIAMDNSYKDIADLSVTVKFKLVDEDDTSLLVWTTTPWTLPANSATAVGEDIDYQKVELDGEFYIVSAPALLRIKNFTESNPSYKVIQKGIKGKDLIGKKYKPIFPYFENKDVPSKENLWKIYSAPFVTADSGTGIVHISPAYGEDDMALAREKNIPYFKHVESNGVFTSEITDFAGQHIKPKDDPEKGIDHMQTDIEIVKYLAHNGHLFSKEKIRHSYPHCHRCETPLFYNAISAWFLNIQKIKDQLLGLNEEINWIPAHLRDGRFKNIVAGAPDWNISRNRYWASPLPFWRKENSDDFIVIGSKDELKSFTKKSGNKYFLMRHGGAESNAQNFASADNSVKSDLTTEGVEQAKKTAEFFKDKNIDVIIASPLLRTQKTAEIVANAIGFDENKIIFDERLMEINSGELNGRPIEEYRALFSTQLEKFEKRPPQGENLMDVKKRAGEFIYDLEDRYSGKNILVVTHEYVVWMLEMVRDGLKPEEGVCIKEDCDDYINVGEAREFDFVPIPHNRNYELDFHRPYIDEITLVDTDGTKLKRIPEVIDCWMESGSMPFAQSHYPFNKEAFSEKKPAQFVAEYIGQTRTWFYYCHVISTALFGRIPYENIITTGTVLNEDGDKMSKSKNNFPDPWDVFKKYGVDAERFYLLSSPVLKAEDLDFSEKGVDEIFKKIIQRLQNVISFYEMYVQDAGEYGYVSSENILDQWINSRLIQVGKEVTKSMEDYEIDRATRPLLDFIDDLSTWYLRRSRDRFKESGEDASYARQTLAYVLMETAKLLAPFTPFISEDIYQRLTGKNFQDENASIHLENWTNFDEKNSDENLINEMSEVRRLVSLTLEARTKVGIKVRQPLSGLSLKNGVLKDSSRKSDLIRIIADEVNVKTVSLDDNQAEKVSLDTNLTEELKKEGDIRELIRAIQSQRKSANLAPQDRILVTIKTDETGKSMIESFRDEISKVAGVDEFKFEDNEGENVEGSMTNFTVSIDRK